MRVFCATMLILGGGCAFGDDNRPAQDDDDAFPPNAGEVVEGVTPRIAAVCDEKTWDVIPDTKHLDVAVVQTAAGASIFGVPTDGGAVRGFRIDQRGDVVDRDMVAIREDRNYTSVSASVAADRLVVASVIGDKVAIDIVRDDLGAVHGLGDVSGTLVDVPMLTSRDEQIALVGGSFGMFANGFTGGLWEPTGEVELTKSAITSLTATSYLDDAIFAWSTDTKECFVQRYASRETANLKFGCEGVRISMNDANGRGMLVFEEAGEIYRTDIYLGAQNNLATKVRIADIASSPRVVFDGEHHWISYINARGDVVVGFVDERGNLISRALEGTTPSERDSYELAVFGNGVWVVNVDTEGFGAQRMCIREQ